MHLKECCWEEGRIGSPSWARTRQSHGVCHGSVVYVSKNVVESKGELAPRSGLELGKVMEFATDPLYTFQRMLLRVRENWLPELGSN
ncbi:hypothetical protein A3744_15085 [Oleiphilus sp. HI0073]|nr:hypothetical protein A3744_15085 [Oleiphilus sp. HI0073]KZZ75018.1 hypothetical protein A3767_15395 [Oleiphilus sp. HI0133]KZZ79218.1 hypothetical protein A3767_33190 [Oleiphilus sp. HI0133]